jgi:ATP-dependent Clp protease adaptor protein ClpS
MDMRTRWFSTKAPEIGEDVLQEIEEKIQLGWKIVVFNDDVNSFQHVIISLMEILNHTEEQATQCAWIIHHKGRCTVKEGSFDTLKPLCEAITERGIDARILEE